MNYTSNACDLTSPDNLIENSPESNQHLFFDPITDLYNHSAFHFQLDQELRRANRYQKQFAIALIDIDDFTYYNEANSYTKGDLMLKSIGQGIKAAIREVDIAARFSGDQFSVLITENEKQKALVIAERIRKKIYHAAGKCLTVSIGIASFPGDAAQGKSLLKKAKEALRQAKTLGKNRVYQFITTEAKDNYTYGHVERVANLAINIGNKMDLSKRDLDAVWYAGVLHDIGKVGIPDHILKKPGALEQHEWEIMRTHSELGYKICLPLQENLGDALKAIRHHHEKLDGSGYPDRLKGEDIPLMARILTVVDMFDALCSDRPYREGLSFPKAIEILAQGAAVGKIDNNVFNTLCKIIT